MRMLERSRERRYPDARAAQRDLEAVLADRGGVPSSAALSEFMSVLFRETLEKRVFVENTMTAVIPLTGTAMRQAPTVIEAPPPVLIPQAITAPIPSRSGAMAMLGVALGLIVGVGATVWYSKRPAPRAIVAGEGAQKPPPGPLPLVEPVPLVTELGPAHDGGVETQPATAVERPLAPMEIRHGRVQRQVKFGYIAINTEPWTNVKLGGRLLGTTPLRDMKLPVGQHKLTFENPQMHLRITVKVDVREGQHTQHRFMLQRAPGGSWSVARHLTL
jgi:serine/threonine-protein kinase